MPHLNPVGLQSTNWMVRLDLMVWIAAFVSFVTTSPRYISDTAMYFPIWNIVSNTYERNYSKNILNRKRREERGEYTVARITLNHETTRFEHVGGDLRDIQSLVRCTLSCDEWCVPTSHEVYTLAESQTSMIES